MEYSFHINCWGKKTFFLVVNVCLQLHSRNIQESLHCELICSKRHKAIIKSRKFFIILTYQFFNMCELKH